MDQRMVVLGYVTAMRDIITDEIAELKEELKDAQGYDAEEIDDVIEHKQHVLKWLKREAQQFSTPESVFRIWVQ